MRCHYTPDTLKPLPLRWSAHKCEYVLSNHRWADPLARPSRVRLVEVRSATEQAASLTARSIRTKLLPTSSDQFRIVEQVHNSETIFEKWDHQCRVEDVRGQE